MSVAHEITVAGKIAREYQFSRLRELIEQAGRTPLSQFTKPELVELFDLAHGFDIQPKRLAELIELRRELASITPKDMHSVAQADIEFRERTEPRRAELRDQWRAFAA